MSYPEMNAMGVYVPNVVAVNSDYGRNALKFIRNCEGLKCIKDTDKKGYRNIPYNFERDIDRLCFENAVARFLQTGSREDAFDVYFCFSEIFKPFGEGYSSTRVMLELLSEHEANSSTLLMKHRDHYSHAVYVFLIGLCIYGENASFRQAYGMRYNDSLTPDQTITHHFLEHWGLAALFHDVGYPFEIAHQQMKAYMQLLGMDFSDKEFTPYVSYKGVKEFATEGQYDLIDILSKEIADRYGSIYPNATYEKLEADLRDRVVYDTTTDHAYMDHAFFSALVLFKKYIRQKGALPSEAMMDALVAILLHNSLFKHSIRGGRPLELTDGQPLSYLLMLCDELQCWDRVSYGKNSRRGIYPCSFDIRFEDVDGSGETRMVWGYFYDQTNAHLISSGGENAKQYTEMSVPQDNGKPKFLNEINDIVKLDFIETELHTCIVPNTKKTRRYLSDSNYLNLYQFAVILNARYDPDIDVSGLTEMSSKDREAFELKMIESFDKLSLEVKLSNIAEAKGFASILDKIGCFYTDRPVDYEEVHNFSETEVEEIGFHEHMRWYEEKAAMGWSFGNKYKNNDERELTRTHINMVDAEQLSADEKLRDTEPMRLMLKILGFYEGIKIYRL